MGKLPKGHKTTVNCGLPEQEAKAAVEPDNTWYRLEIIKTGKNYISQAEHVQRRFMGDWSSDVEQVQYSTEDKEIINLVKIMLSKDKEIKRLESVIKQYQEATDRIQGALK